MKNIVYIIRPNHMYFHEEFWACRNETEALTMIVWLKDNHIEAKTCDAAECDRMCGEA